MEELEKNETSTQAEENTVEDRIIEAWEKCTENMKRAVWGLE